MVRKAVQTFLASLLEFLSARCEVCGSSRAARGEQVGNRGCRAKATFPRVLPETAEINFALLAFRFCSPGG
jgi:hypothetical protein